MPRGVPQGWRLGSGGASRIAKRAYLEVRCLCHLQKSARTSTIPLLGGYFLHGKQNPINPLELIQNTQNLPHPIYSLYLQIHHSNEVPDSWSHHLQRLSQHYTLLKYSSVT